MPVLVFCILSALGQNVAAPPPKPVSAEVVVSGRLLPIPALPSSVKQAKAEQATLKPQIAQSLQDLELHLGLLQRTIDGQPCPTSIKAQKDRAADIRFILSVLKDEPYETLAEQFRKTWDAWHTCLADQGLVQTPSDDKALEAPLPDPLELDPAAAVTRPLGSGTNKPVEYGLMPRADQNTFATDKASARVTEQLANRAEAYERKTRFNERTASSRQLMLVADRMAPDLARDWAPLVEHLNTCARRLADLDQTPSQGDSPDLRLLRFYALRAFLERVRLAVWLCGTVRAELTSDTPPPPLRPLG